MNEDLTGRNLVELIDLLEPAPEPAPISMMPATSGWIWLGLLLIAAITLLVRWLLARRRANAYRRAALQELSSAGFDAVAIAAIIRRTALAAYPRDRVAHLHGEAWLRFLDESCGGRGFSNGSGRAIVSAPYTATNSDAGLVDVARDWIRRHRGENR